MRRAWRITLRFRDTSFESRPLAHWRRGRTGGTAFVAWFWFCLHIDWWLYPIVPLQRECRELTAEESERHRKAIEGFFK